MDKVIKLAVIIIVSCVANNACSLQITPFVVFPVIFLLCLATAFALMLFWLTKLVCIFCMSIISVGNNGIHLDNGNSSGRLERVISLGKDKICMDAGTNVIPSRLQHAQI